MTKMMSPHVTVITAFLNEVRFLAEAIESVLRQDYRHWELILVDDGSSDGSVAMAKDYARKYGGKIRYTQHEGHCNKGLSASCNRGISLAKGDLVAFLDADDVWLPAKLSNQVAVFQQHPVTAMLAEASVYWYSWNDPDREDTTVLVGAPQDTLFQPGELLEYLYPLSSGAAPCPSGLMASREALYRVGGFEESFIKEYQLYEDQAFLHKMYLKEQVYVSSCCNNRYRQRTGSIVDQVTLGGHYHRVRKYFLGWLKTYLEQEQIQDKSIHRRLHKALAPYLQPSLYFFTIALPAWLKKFLDRRWIKLRKYLGLREEC